MIRSWQAPILVGGLLRLLLFFSDDSLWRDEASLLMGLYSVSNSDLFSELPFGQRSPFALALLWKSMMENIIGTTYIMRLPSLAAGIAQLFVFTLTIKKLFKPNNYQVNLAIWIVAVSPNLILFSNQIKPYIFDVLCSTILIALSLPFFLRKQVHVKQSILLILASWASLFFSYPCSFVVGGICLGLLFDYGFRRLPLLLTLSIGTFVILIFIFIESGETSEYLSDFWKSCYPEASIWWWLRALGHTLFFGLSSPTFLSTKELLLIFGWLFFPLCALGAMNLWKMKKIGLLCSLLFPSVICLAASFLHKYPYGGRLILFMMPQYVVLLSLGLVYILSNSTAYSSALQIIAQSKTTIIGKVVKNKSAKVAHYGVVAMIILCGIISILEYSYPCKGIRSGLDYIALHEKERDIVIVDEYASQVVKYYQLLAKKDNSRQFPESDFIMPWQDPIKREGRPKIEEVADHLPFDSRIWIIGESEGYHRHLTTSNSLIVTKMVTTLMDSRQKLFQLDVPRLFVACFSEKRPISRGVQFELGHAFL
jgi:hypothetical protein